MTGSVTKEAANRDNCHKVIIYSAYDDVVAHKIAVNSYISISRCPLENIGNSCLAYAQTTRFSGSAGLEPPFQGI